VLDDDDDDEPPTLHIETAEEFAEIMLRMVVKEEAKIERQAAETGKPVDASFVLAHCEPGQPATHSIDYLDDQRRRRTSAARAVR
jgi:hypothetical protein